MAKRKRASRKRAVRGTGMVPAKVRLNPKTGRVQIFVTPENARRLRNPKGYYKVWFTRGRESTAKLVVDTEKYPKGKTSIAAYSRLFPYSEARKMGRIHTSKVYPTWGEAFRA